MSDRQVTKLRRVLFVSSSSYSPRSLALGLTLSSKFRPRSPRFLQVARFPPITRAIVLLYTCFLKNYESGRSSRTAISVISPDEGLDPADRMLRESFTG